MASWPLRPALRLAALGGRSLLAANLGLRLLQGSLPLLGLVAMQRLLDAVAKGIAGDPTAATEVWYAVAFATAVALVGAVVAMFGQTVAERHARRCADRCASLVQRHAAALDLEQIESPNVRDLLHRAAGDALSRPVRIVQDLGAFAVAATMLSTMVATVATAALWLPALLALAAVPQVLVRHRHSRLQFAWVEDNTEAQRRVGYLGGLLVGRPWAKDLRMLELAGPVATRVERERQRLTEEQLALAARRARAEALAQGLSTVSMFAAYAYLAFEALAGGLSLGGLLLLAQAAQRTQNGVRDCLLAHAALCDDQRFVRHLFSFLELRPRAVPASAAESAAEPGPRSPLSIAVRNVHYTYPERGNATLNGLSFEVGAGERVALVGGNGAGKSTLVRLLCGLAQPSEGSIELGGIDLRRIPPAELHQRVAVFFQDTTGFELSMRDNLAFGSPPDSDASLRERARACGLEPLLAGLPEDLGQVLGRSFQGSRELSAGQWRRLFLVRTLLRASDLLVLDEPFAFLDAAAQRALVQHLNAPPWPRTVLWIDHRPPEGMALGRAIQLVHGREAGTSEPG